ncbi:SLC25A51.2 family protein [Megaselia abdita]
MSKDENNVVPKYNWRISACGLGAACINILITYPMQKIIVRQMIHGFGLRSAVRHIGSDGIFYLYRGVLPPLMHKSINMAIIFQFYDASKNAPQRGILFNIISGVASGVAETVMTPFERLQTLLTRAKYHELIKNSNEALLYVWSNYGIKELYRGWTPILYRNSVGTSSFFIGKDIVDRNVPMNLPISLRVQEFIGGAMIGGVISSMSFPFNVVRVNMQSEVGHPTEHFHDCLKRVYMERKGITGFYKGSSVNTLRSSLSWGILNTSYETLRKILC